MSKSRNTDAGRLADLFKALSNPKRLEIFLRLVPGLGSKVYSCRENGVCACVGELGRDLGIVASTVSHHIRELHQAGLILVERRGQSVECRANPEVVEELAAFFKTSPNEDSP